MKHTHTQARAQTPDCFRFERADQAIIVHYNEAELGGQRRQQTEEEKEEDRRRREATPPSTCK